MSVFGHPPVSSHPPCIDTLSCLPDDAEGMAGTVGGLVVRYLAERHARGELSVTSARTYREALWLLVISLGGSAVPVARLTRRRIERWLEADVSPATRRNRLSICRGFCLWLVREGHLRRDPTVGIASPRQPRYVPRGLKHDAVTRTIIGAPDERARLILLLMCQEGLRAREVAALQLGDVDWEDRAALVHGKAGHQRVLPLSPETMAALDTYLTVHPPVAGPLVRSYTEPHAGIGAKYVAQLASRYLHFAGVNATGHALRHTAATDMLRAGAHVRDVQAALGHASLATTQRYMPWLVGDLRKAMGGRKYGAAALRTQEANGGSGGPDDAA